MSCGLLAVGLFLLSYSVGKGVLSWLLLGHWHFGSFLGGEISVGCGLLMLALTYLLAWCYLRVTKQKLKRDHTLLDLIIEDFSYSNLLVIPYCWGLFYVLLFLQGQWVWMPFLERALIASSFVEVGIFLYLLVKRRSRAWEGSVTIS